MTLVVDASVVVAALVDTGPAGTWAESQLVSAPLSAPHLMPVEVVNVLRRLARAGEVSGDVASLAHAELRSLQVSLFPYALVAQRVWELRENLTAYDAWYVALAESFGAPLATLDARLPNVPGLNCEVIVGP